MEIDIGEIILEEELNIGEIELDVIKEYPELESLEVIPTSEKQTFKSNEYGYDEVIVNAIESEELNMIPSSEEQVKEGMFNKVTIAGDTNLVPDNIKDSVEIFGVTGTAETTSAKITDARYLFYNGYRLDYMQELIELCKNLIDTSNMFYGCSSLKELDLSNFDTSKVKSMSSMLYGCSSLINIDLSNFNTGNVTDMNNMFYGCSSLKKLNLVSFNTSNLVFMNSIFYGCSSLINIDLSNFDTSKVIQMSNMLYGCNSLINLDISNFDMSEVNAIYNMLNCSKLTNLIFGTNLGKGYVAKTNNFANYKLDLSKCTLLTHDSLMSVINNLYDLNLTYDVANGGKLYAQTLNLGSKNKSKLTEEEIAIATNKGWNVL